MKTFAQGRLIIFANLFAGIIFQGYKSVGPEEKKYESLAEKTRLFKKVDCLYSSKLDIQYSEFNRISHKRSFLYKQNPELYEAYAQKYANDVERKHHAPMYLKWISDVIGYGVFASSAIKKGDLIGEYFGILRKVQSGSDNLDYAWYYSLDDLKGEKLVVDGKNQGNELRFINHAVNPNTIRIDVLGNDGIFHIAYIACEDIQVDEQLTVSYGDGYFTSRSMKIVDV